MADSDFSAPLQSSYLMPTPPGPHVQGPEVPAPPLFQPNFTNYSSMSFEAGGYHHPFYPGQYSHMSETNQGVTAPFHYHHNRLTQHQFTPHNSHRGPGYYPPPADMFSHSLNPVPPSGPFHNMQMPGSPHPELAEVRSRVDLFATDPSIPNPVPPYNLPHYSHVPPPQLHGFSPYSGRRAPPIIPSPPLPQLGRFGEGPLSNQTRGHPRASNNSSSTDQPHQLLSPLRRPSYERPHQHGYQGSAPDRRPPSFISSHSRRSDRSVSPRTSHRRSFDRYATDLHPSSSPSETDEATLRARLVQRRQRERRFMRHHFAVDDTTPTLSQMQALKDKLRHFLPSELPEDASTCCDICQKDYSTKHCLPTDEEEVAIQLPCKHVFGEHCINTWFETCKTHKNKITCPMCRKLLIEPMRVPPALVAAMPEVLSLFSRGNQAEQQAILRLARSRELEGDF